jgi:Uma2 family endonuclease
MQMPICYSPAPSTRHQAVVLGVAAALLRHVESRRLGQVLHAPCNVVLPGEAVVQPDVLFVGRERRGIIGRNELRAAPDLVVEVVSRATGGSDILAKKKIYSRIQVPECWMVDLDDDTVEILLWSEVGYLSAGSLTKSDRLASPLLPDLKLPLFRIFRKVRE